MKTKIACIAMTAAVLSACASTQSTLPVIARADASYETTGLGKTKLDAQRHALNTAQKQCGSKTPIIIKDNHTYNGIIGEQAGRVLDKGMGVVGLILGTPTPELSRDDDYEYTINFKCQ